MNMTFRPIDQWPGERTKWPVSSPFKSTYTKTLTLLDRELWMLDAKNVVVQIDMTERDIRQDGMPRADARSRSGAVILAFDSKHGPLKYATDKYVHWEDNVRAIALSLEALRKVDRYGVTKRGEQYTGWGALGSGIPMGSGATFSSLEQAAEFIIEYGEWGGERATANEIIEAEPEILSAYYREAAKKLHPDAGGDPEMFKRLTEAKRYIEEHRS